MPSTLKKPLRFSTDGGREALELFAQKLKALDAETPENVYHCIQEVMAERKHSDEDSCQPAARPRRVRADRTPQIDRTLCLIGRNKVLARIAEGLA